MRAAIVSAFVLLASPCAARAQEVQAVDPAAVVSACAQQVVLPAGRTAEPAEINAYCQCAIDRAATALTPTEFTIFGRIALFRLGAGPPPSAEDRAIAEGIDPAAFERTQQALRAVIGAQCGPILLGPPKAAAH